MPTLFRRIRDTAAPSISLGNLQVQSIYLGNQVFAITQEWNSVKSPISFGIWLPEGAPPEGIYLEGMPTSFR